MKILNAEDLEGAAEALVSAGKLDADENNRLKANMEDAQGAWADAVARAAGVIHHMTDFDLGGLCSSFKPGPGGTTCEMIGDGDPGGEWDED